MRRLFIQIYMVISVAAAIFLVASIALIAEFITDEQSWQEFHNIATAEHYLLSEQLHDKNYSQVQTLLANYRPALGAGVGLSVRHPQELPANLIQTAHTQPVFADPEDEEWFAYFPQTGQDWGLYVDNDVFRWDEEGLAMFLVIILPMLVLLSSFAIGLIWTIRRFAKPLLILEQSAQQLGAGDIQARADIPTNSPVYSLAHNFNQMAAKLEHLFQQQQVMIGAIPHELRTPLHRIRFALDMTRQPQDLNSIRQRIDKVDDYVNELHTAVNDMLELSRLQGGNALVRSQFDVHTLLQEVTQNCAEPSLKLQIDCPTSLQLSASRPLILRALLNLSRNATRYAQQHVCLQAQVTAQGVYLRVMDDGEGIPSQYQQQIFDPFFRADSSRNRATGGIGLGLALVQRIVQTHGGSVAVQANYTAGACLEIFLPQHAK